MCAGSPDKVVSENNSEKQNMQKLSPEGLGLSNPLQPFMYQAEVVPGFLKICFLRRSSHRQYGEGSNTALPKSHGLAAQF